MFSGVAGRGGIPQTEVTSFVGRRRETAYVKRLLTTSRLVTLTGVGGVGKSRLALHVARDLRRAFPEIARGLVIAERTAESHIEHVRAKLGFNSRTQIAAWVTQQQADHQA